jgi:hypothetical protein
MNDVPEKDILGKRTIEPSAPPAASVLGTTDHFQFGAEARLLRILHLGASSRRFIEGSSIFATRRPFSASPSGNRALLIGARDYVEARHVPVT